MTRQWSHRLLALALCTPWPAVPAASQPAPESPQRIHEVTLKAIPTTVTYRGRPVEVRFPSAPEVRALGGSGGPIVEMVVHPPDRTQPVVFETQGIGFALVASSSEWPAFEVWSNAGGGVYTRAVYTWRSVEKRYCSDRVDDFEDDGDETPGAGKVAMIGWGRVVRFARSRPLACEG